MQTGPLPSEAKPHQMSSQTVRLQCWERRFQTCIKLPPGHHLHDSLQILWRKQPPRAWGFRLSPSSMSPLMPRNLCALQRGQRHFPWCALASHLWGYGEVCRASHKIIFPTQKICLRSAQLESALRSLDDFIFICAVGVIWHQQSKSTNRIIQTQDLLCFLTLLQTLQSGWL